MTVTTMAKAPTPLAPTQRVALVLGDIVWTSFGVSTVAGCAPFHELSWHLSAPARRPSRVWRRVLGSRHEVPLQIRVRAHDWEHTTVITTGSARTQRQIRHLVHQAKAGRYPNRYATGGATTRQANEPEAWVTD
jgi:hypothetical protein